MLIKINSTTSILYIIYREIYFYQIFIFDIIENKSYWHLIQYDHIDILNNISLIKSYKNVTLKNNVRIFIKIRLLNTKKHIKIIYNFKRILYIH